MKKVNLGCGSHLIKEKGWINVDDYVILDAKNFVKADVRDLPFDKETVDYIICDQVLEHLPMADVLVVLQEIRRVLKKGGKATIIVPDFEDAARQWLQADLNMTFDPMRYKWFSEVVYGNQEHEGEFHKTAMSPRFLDYCLKTAGLTKNKILFFPAFGNIPKYEGMRPYADSAKLRNAQLVVEIIK